MNNTKIEWADMTWNPVTGCQHGCSYCYARMIADRFASKDYAAILETANYKSIHVLQEPYVHEGKIEPYPYGFHPTLHMYRLKELEDIRKPKNIFVCSMSDLFGDWVPDWWIASVLEACRRHPQHRYLFLTKNPRRYVQLLREGYINEGDTNFWLGTTVTGLVENPGFWHVSMHTFWSCEPLLAPWPPLTSPPITPMLPEWVILGAETGNRRGKVIPKREWIEDIVRRCRKRGVSILMKESLAPIIGEDLMLREFPEALL